MRKPKQVKEATIEVALNLANASYTISRTVKQGKGTVRAEFRKDGKLIEVDAAPVTTAVERLLQMDYDLFAKAVYADQNGLDYFLRLPRGGRTEQIDRLLRLDRFAKVKERGRQLANRMKSEAEENDRLAHDLAAEEVTERLALMTQEIQELQKQQTTIHQKSVSATTAREQVHAAVTRLEEQQQARGTQEGRLHQTAGFLKALDERIARLQDALKTQHEEQLTRTLERTKKQLADHQKIAERTKESLYVATERRRSVLDRIKRTAEVTGACPICGKELTAAHKEKLERERRLVAADLSKTIDQLTMAVATVEQEIATLRKTLVKTESAFEGHARLQHELAENREQHAKQKAQYTTAQEALASITQVDPRKLEEARQLLKDALEKESSLVAEARSWSQRIVDKQEVAKELTKKQTLLQSLQERIERKQRAHTELGVFTKAVTGAQEGMRTEFLGQVNRILEQVWTQLYPYGDFTGLRLAGGQDYVLEVKEGARWVSIEGLASGGERSLAALALRIAFSLAFLPNLRLLILDEPTHNLDERAIQRFAQFLDEGIPFAKQVFLITHEERLSEIGNGTVYRLQREKSVDGVTKVEDQGRSVK